MLQALHQTPPSAIRAIIVDDERGCRELLAAYLGTHCPAIQIVGLADSANSASHLMNGTAFDVAFLDVELIDQSVFSILNMLPDRSFNIVFVTAFERYALPAFRASAVDYLLKPLAESDIVSCYQKLLGNARHPGKPGLSDPAPVKIILRQGEEVYVITTDDVLFLKASGFYTLVHFMQGGRSRTLTVSKPIRSLAQQWNMPGLIQVHRSYMVNLSQVARVRKSSSGMYLCMKDGTAVPVAKRRANEVLSRYNP